MMTAQPSDQSSVIPARPVRGERVKARKLRDAKDAVYREHIMEVAEHLFAQQGFASTRMQGIAGAAGISLGTLYQSYAGKRDLYRSLLIARDKQMFDEVMSKGRDVLERMPQSVEQLLWLMESHVRFLLEHADYLRIRLHEGYAWYHEADHPSPEEQRMWDRGLVVIEQALCWGMDRGHFIAGDAGDQARLMMTLQQTRLANWVMAGMQLSHADVIAQVQADFVRQFCRPLLASAMLLDNGGGLRETVMEKIRTYDE